jgi:hypothetical protein
MYYDPMPLAYAFLRIPSSAIPDEEVVDAAPLNQGPPSTSARAGQKWGVNPNQNKLKHRRGRRSVCPFQRSRGLLPRGNFLPLILFPESFFF